MPSFAWRSRVREGQWRAFRQFLLEERRDAGSRIQVIEAELGRIGNIRVLFERLPSGVVTERRVGLSVTPPNSSLAKLLIAYTAQGGNPFDISMFLHPDRSIAGEGEVWETLPSGGVLHPQSIRYSYDVGVTDGDLSLKSYQSSRVGGKHQTAKEQEVLGITYRARRWIEKEISYKRNQLEERIIKLMDLREQLEGEIEDLVWATYGDLSGVGWDPDRYNRSLTAAAISYWFDSTFRIPEADDPTRIVPNDGAGSGEAGALNIEVLGGYQNLITDDDEEGGSAL